MPTRAAIIAEARAWIRTAAAAPALGCYADVAQLYRHRAGDGTTYALGRGGSARRIRRWRHHAVSLARRFHLFKQAIEEGRPLDPSVVTLANCSGDPPANHSTPYNRMVFSRPAGAQHFSNNGIFPNGQGLVLTNQGQFLATADIISRDHEAGARLINAAHEQMNMRIVRVPVIDGDPIEPSAEIAFHLPGEHA